MAAPYLVRCLVQLRDEFDQFAPVRDKASDGWIADAAHSSTSDHQADAAGRVRAIDVDSDLRRPGITMADAFGLIIVRHQLGEDDRLEYAIFNRLIYSRSRGYKPISYAGTDPHTNHAHFSARHDGTGWTNDTRPWGLLEDDDMDEADMRKLAGFIAEAIMGSKVMVGGQPWRYDTAIGYQTRKAYEIDLNTEAKPTAPPA
jgi:hypothetical protein